MSGISGLLGGLFPNLAQRKRARTYNKLIKVADRLENERIQHGNRMADKEARFEMWANDVAARKVMRDLGASLSEMQAQYAEGVTERGLRRLQAEMSEKQAVGVIYAQQAANGLAGSALSKQLANAARMGFADQKGMINQEARSAARQYRMTARDVAANAMDAMPSNVIAPQLDFNVVKSEEMKVKSVWSSVFHDVGRLVATYYTGGMATPFIDQAFNYQGNAANAQQGIETAYGRIFGGSRRPPNTVGPDLTALVGMAGSYRGMGGSASSTGGNRGAFNWGGIRQNRTRRPSNGYSMRESYTG